MCVPRGGGAVLSVFLALAYLICLGNAEDCAAGGPNTESYRLKTKLFCGYERNVIPILNHKEAIKVVGSMILQKLVFHENVNYLAIHAFMSWEWTDQFLKWNPSDYDGLDRIVVTSSDIWLPDIGLALSPVWEYSSSHTADVTCRLYSTGQVSCHTPTAYYSSCVTDVTKWPFDSQNCSLQIASLTSKKEMIDFDFKGVQMENYVANRDWELLNVQSNKLPTLHPTISVSFSLKRHSGGHSSTVVIPAFILALLTLVGFWIEPHASVRLCLICLNILCHCLYLQYLGYNLPNYGDTMPRILSFFRDSLLLTGGSLVVTLIVRRMFAASSPPPTWAAALASGVADSFIGQAILCGDPMDVDAAPPGDDDDVPLVGKSASARTWRLLATILDRAAFAVFFLIYFVLLIAFIP